MNVKFNKKIKLYNLKPNIMKIYVINIKINT